MAVNWQPDAGRTHPFYDVSGLMIWADAGAGPGCFIIAAYAAYSAASAPCWRKPVVGDGEVVYPGGRGELTAAIRGAFVIRKRRIRAGECESSS